MKTHEMTLKAPFFEQVAQNKKLYEIRVFDEKRRKLLLGDKIIFKKKDSSDTIEKTVSKLMLFDTFKETLQSMKDFREALPSIASIEEGVSLYENIPHEVGNYKKASEKFGIVLIKLA